MKKFYAVIGNPPYQVEQEGDNVTYAPPIYHHFLDSSYEVSRKVELVHPARFLFNAGSTPKEWNEKMLSDKHLKILSYHEDPTDIFPGTDIKGGVVVSYHDEDTDFGAIEVFNKFEEVNSVMKKAAPKSPEQSIASIITIQNRFDLDRLYQDHPDYRTKQIANKKGKLVNIIGNNGKDSRFEKDIFQKIPLFTESPVDGDSILVLGIYKLKRSSRYIPKAYVDCAHESLFTYKVVIPVANGSGQFGEALSKPEILKPGEGFTRSFIGIGMFETEGEALAAEKYIKTKMCRTMLSIFKVTQMANKDVWRYVPLQDFSDMSDIDWSLSVSEIDQQLYKTI